MWPSWSHWGSWHLGLLGGQFSMYHSWNCSEFEIGRGQLHCFCIISDISLSWTLKWLSQLVAGNSLPWNWKQMSKPGYSQDMRMGWRNLSLGCCSTIIRGEAHVIRLELLSYPFGSLNPCLGEPIDPGPVHVARRLDWARSELNFWPTNAMGQDCTIPNRPLGERFLLYLHIDMQRTRSCTYLLSI